MASTYGIYDASEQFGPDAFVIIHEATNHVLGHHTKTGVEIFSSAEEAQDRIDGRGLWSGSGPRRIAGHFSGEDKSQDPSYPIGSDAYMLGR